jgi:chromosome segregation ATPase
MNLNRRAELEKRLADYKAKREKLSVALDESLANAEVQTYSLNDSEGGQSATRRSPQELMKLIDDIESKIDSLEALLASGGIHIASLRRI